MTRWDPPAGGAAVLSHTRREQLSPWEHHRDLWKVIPTVRDKPQYNSCDILILESVSGNWQPLIKISALQRTHDHALSVRTASPLSSAAQHGKTNLRQRSPGYNLLIWLSMTIKLLFQVQALIKFPLSKSETKTNGAFCPCRTLSAHCTMLHI